MMYLWVFPGYLGIVPAVILLGLFIEAAIRIHQLRRRQAGYTSAP